MTPMRVFVTGGTGFVGQQLVAALVARGDRVTVLSRSTARARQTLGDEVDCIEGNSALGGDWQQQVSGHDAVVNLAGQAIGGKRWNARYKQILTDSRVETTRYVAEALEAASERPKVLVSASGTDYYPFDVDLDAAGLADLEDDVAVTESARPGDSFLARLCRSWEAEAMCAVALGVRVVCMRSGVVLGDQGPLQQMAKPFRFLLGGKLGKGRQWFSWIHLDDAVAGYVFALDRSDVTGAVNLVAPGAVRNVELTRALAKALHRPAIMPVPTFALKLALGEFHEYLVHGRRVVPEVLVDAGFEFRYPDIAVALASVYG